MLRLMLELGWVLKLGGGWGVSLLLMMMMC